MSAAEGRSAQSFFAFVGISRHDLSPHAQHGSIAVPAAKERAQRKTADHDDGEFDGALAPPARMSGLLERVQPCSVGCRAKRVGRWLHRAEQFIGRARGIDQFMLEKIARPRTEVIGFVHERWQRFRFRDRRVGRPQRIGRRLLVGVCGCCDDKVQPGLKWCTRAPLDTPARSLIPAIAVPA